MAISQAMSHVWLKGGKLGLSWTENYNRMGTTYLSVGCHSNISTSNYTLALSVFLVCIIRNEMSNEDVGTMHGALIMTIYRFNMT